MKAAGLFLPAAALFVCIASSAMARTWEVQTAPGGEASHNYCTGITRACAETALPQITVTTPPSNGSVSYNNTVMAGANVRNRVGENRYQNQCPVQPRHCLTIIYSPRPGFHGIDRLSYTVTNPGGQTWQDSITAKVR